MASLLLIGGSGFFGKSILDCFRRGMLEKWNIDQIIVLARAPQTLQSECPELLSAKVKLVAGDISSAAELPKADYIIHAASSTNAQNYINNGENELNNITSGIKHFVSLIQNYNRDVKILYTSSGAVYGFQSAKAGKISEIDNYGDIDQLDETKKLYAYGKRRAEKEIIKLGESGFNVSIARCFSFYGKYLPHDWHFAIGNFIAEAKEKKEIIVRARKKVIRSYLHADDLVEWLMKILITSDASCPVYNVGSDEAIEIRSLAKLIAERFGAVVFESEIETHDVDFYVPSVDRIKKELGAKININMREMIGMADDSF